MSGIYIPELKDLSCDDCFWGIGSRLGCHATPEAVTRKINGRAADCPLIFLEDHGRLVDADAPIKVWDVQFPSGKTTVSKLLLSKILGEIPPTIIPADGKDTNVHTREEGEG